MTTQIVKIENAEGLHMHSAMYFVQKANTYFNTSIRVKKGDKSANGKSLLGVLYLGIEQGTEIEIEANGAEEKEAVTNLVEYLTTGYQAN